MAHGSHWHPTGSASASPAAEDAAKVADVKADDIVTASVTATVARQTSQKNEKKAVGKEAAVVSPEPAVVAPPAAIQAALDSMVALKLTACHTLPELALHELQLSQVGTGFIWVRYFLAYIDPDS